MRPWLDHCPCSGCDIYYNYATRHQRGNWGISVLFPTTAREPNNCLEIKINNTPWKKTHGVKRVYTTLRKSQLKSQMGLFHCFCPSRSQDSHSSSCLPSAQEWERPLGTGSSCGLQVSSGTSRRSGGGGRVWRRSSQDAWECAVGAANSRAGGLASASCRETRWPRATLNCPQNVTSVDCPSGWGRGRPRAGTREYYTY